MSSASTKYISKSVYKVITDLQMQRLMSSASTQYISESVYIVITDFADAKVGEFSFYTIHFKQCV